MKKLLTLLVLITISSCTSSTTPVTSESSTLVPRNTGTSTPIHPISTFTLPASSPTSIPTKTPSPQLSSLVQLKYPNHENCKIQVNTQKWEITEEGRKSIAGSMSVPISHKLGIGGILFARHKSYSDCTLSWITNGYRDVAQTSLETINGKTWKVWGIERLFSTVYVWPEVNEIQFVWVWTLLDVSEKGSCQVDVYEVLGSLQCE
ncbi:MAG: hypothetical protein ACOYZ6_00020 [Chloroflexota bacterium]